MPEASHERAVQAAKDQSLFREVNEQMRELNEAFETATRESRFVCECANRDCLDHVSVTLEEYEEIRRVPTHFVVAPGHVYRDVERVVWAVEEHVVVEKVGDAGIAAFKLDPRLRHRPSEQ